MKKQNPPYAPIETTVESMLSKMTLREKIGQTCQAKLGDVLTQYAGDLPGYFHRFPVGSLFAGQEIIGGTKADATTMHQVLCDCQQASVIPLSIAGDLENGAGGAIRGMTPFPPLLCLGATSDPALAYDYGRLTAHEARQVGFNWTFGPVADLSLNWLNPIVGTRCLGDRADDIIPLLQALIRGFQEHGLSATSKHFPGDGVDFRDQHLGLAINSLEEDAWWASYGRVFGTVVSSGVQAIMAGHIALPWCDAFRGRGGRFTPATVSTPILTQLLRNHMGFKGIIVSDALIMAGFTSWAAYKERILAAFNAGVDVMLWPGDDYFNLMIQAMDSGRISMARLDESVRRILTFKVVQGILKPDGCKPIQPTVTSHITPCAEALTFASTLADRGLTLVRNRRETLPLPVDRIKTALVLYATPRPSGAAGRLTPFLRGLEARGISVRLHINGNCLDVNKMEQAGDHFDAFFCLFDQKPHDLKNTMRPSGEMGECIWTLQYTETLEPIIISLGNAYLLNDMPFADTLVNAYSADTATLEALVPALFGETGFPGKSPVQTGGDWVSREICALPEGCRTAGPGIKPAPAAATCMEAKRFTTPFGESLPYRLYSPPQARANGQKYPAIVLLHGAGERGQDNTSQLAHGAGSILAYLQRTNTAAYVIAPQCPLGMQWANAPWAAMSHHMPEYPSLPMKLVLELIENRLETLPLDPNRLYITGLSMGGYGSWDAMQRRPDLFAAGAPVCGGGDVELASRIKNIPTRVYHGALDNVVPVVRSRAMVEALQMAGGNPIYTEYPDVGHNAWEKAYEEVDLYPWLFAQHR